MIFLRKFFNVEAEAITNAGGNEAEVIEKEEKKEEQPLSAAALMAKGGIKTTEGKVAEKSTAIKETEVKTEETKTDAPAETAKEEVKVDKVEAEVSKESEQKVEAKVQTTEDKPKPEVSIQEFLKQPKAVFEAMGFVPEMADLTKELSSFKGEELQKAINIVKAFTSGKGEEYLKEVSKDYANMSSEDVMRHQLQKEYPKAGQKALDALYQKKIIETYNLDSEDDAELETGKLLLDAEADKHRDQFIENQKKYAAPIPSPKEEEKVTPNAEEEYMRQEVDNVSKKFRDNSYTQGILSSGVLTIGKGDEAFNFPLKIGEQGAEKNISADILDLAINGDKSGNLLFNISTDASGRPVHDPKVEHNLLVATVMHYGKDYIDAAIKFGKSLGAAKLRDQITNAKKEDTTINHTTETSNDSAAAQLAKGGKRVNG